MTAAPRVADPLPGGLDAQQTTMDEADVARAAPASSCSLSQSLRRIESLLAAELGGDDPELLAWSAANDAELWSALGALGAGVAESDHFFGGQQDLDAMLSDLLALLNAEMPGVPCTTRANH